MSVGVEHWALAFNLSSLPTLLFGDEGHLEVGVSLHVVLVHVSLDLRVVGVDALVQVALLLVVGALALAEHLVDNVKCFVRDPMVMMVIWRNEYDGDHADEEDGHLVLIYHLPKREKLLAAHFPVF